LRFTLALRSLGAGLTVAFVLAVLAVGVARAAQAAHPNDPPASIASMRALVDHYRSLAWTYQRAGHVPRTPTSFSYRRSTDRSYLQWILDAWTRRAYAAQGRALTAIHRRLAVPLPAQPALHAGAATRLRFSRQITLRLRHIYPGTVTRAFASARARDDRGTLRLWQERSAAATLAVAVHGSRQPDLPAWLEGDFMCIHHHEGAWTENTGNGYYGGLQMDLAFQRLYGAEFLTRFGTADTWPVWAQLEVAGRAYGSGRGFAPWPNTARACGLL
jgi:Transglycosylase-like domain